MIERRSKGAATGGAEGSKGEWDLSDEATESNCEYIIRVLKRDYVACGT